MRAANIDRHKRDTNMDPVSLKQKISKILKLLFLCIWRCGCQMDEIMAIAKQHHLLVLEDAAQAAGRSCKDEKLGT